MPKRKLEFKQGSYYHIYNRGADRRSIFLTDENYRHVLRLMQRYVRYFFANPMAYRLPFYAQSSSIGSTHISAARLTQHIPRPHPPPLNLQHPRRRIILPPPIPQLYPAPPPPQPSLPLLWTRPRLPRISKQSPCS